MVLLRGTIVNRTYGLHKDLYIYLFLLIIFWSYLLWPPVIDHADFTAPICRRHEQDHTRWGKYVFLERSTLDHKVRIDDPIEV